MKLKCVAFKSNHSVYRFLLMTLIVCFLLNIIQPQLVLAATYVDDFSSAPFPPSFPTSFSTGSLETGLDYVCTLCSFAYDTSDEDISAVAFAPADNAYVTITARNGAAFSFSSIYVDTDEAIVISGSGSGPPFSIDVSAGTAATIAPSGGNQIVDTVTISRGAGAADFLLTIDNISIITAPSPTSFTRYTPASPQTNADSLIFRATFDEAVDFVSTEDFSVDSSTTATVTGVSAVSSSVYEVTVSGGDLSNFNGTVGLNLNLANDIVSADTGLSLTANEPTTDQTYLLDNVSPSVTINQAGGQSDPATSIPINFTVIFNEDAYNFTTGDITLGGTAGATTATVTGSGTNYNVAVSGMTSDGTVIASIAGGVATDLAGNANLISTSTDNQVTFDGDPEIDIQRPASTSIADGGTNAIGNQIIGSVNLTYTIDNTAGADILTISNVTSTNESNISNFSLDTATPINVTGGMTGTFDVSFDVTSNGAFSFDMAIANNDSDENPYTITISGTGIGGSPEMDLQRPAATSIADGGSDSVGSQSIGTVNLTYTVDNSAGTDQLSISGVTASNESNVSGFSLDTATPINVAAGSTGTFDISFNVGINGAFGFDMDIANNDSDENPYDVAVSGTGIGGTPEIDIQRPAGTSIADNGTDTLGILPIGTIDLTYTVDNSAGTDQLSISAVTAANQVNATGFTLNTAVPINIPAGGSDSFDISFTVPSAGAFSLDMDITNTDTDESNYDIAINGTSYIEPVMEISFNGTAIANGDTTPTTSEGTDFGDDLFLYLAYSPQHTFTITNTGAGQLLLSDSPRITVTGTDFSLITDAPASIAAGDSATFTVQFAATAIGPRTGNISITNNDTSENPYNFDITGTGYSGPLMIVRGGSPRQDIEDGDTTPSLTDDTEFGAADVTGGTVDHTFEIENFGASDLSLSGSPRVQITGLHAADFSVSMQPGATVSTGVSENFQISFDPNAAGNRTATVTIDNDDPNRNPYTFSIQGQGDNFSVMMGGNTNPTDGEVLTGAPGSLQVQFTREALADSSINAANYTDNYLLVEAGINASFDTVSCAGGIVSDDTQINITTVNYSSLANTATLTVNSADFNSDGQYRLFVCGTTSIYDIFGNELNGGANDTTINFSIATTSNGTISSATSLPATGFPIGRFTNLPEQPAEKQYNNANMVLEIPALGLEVAIVGVPLVDGEWDVSWLNHEAGFLYGTAYPTWKGNTVITGHVWDAYNQPGPFSQLKDLHYGDLIKIYSGNSIYIYEVHDTRLHKAISVSSVAIHEELDWLTLVTCEEYQDSAQSYTYRRVVRSVLVQVIAQ
ncbi:MAG: sortase [Anaerolineaceae bacterium]|nr:sortase [Anaerolineaceae bacterium]